MAKYVDSPDLYIKKGKRVKAYIKTGYYYLGWQTQTNIVKGTIISDPMYDGQIADEFDLVDRPDEVTLNIKRDDDGSIFETTAYDCEPLRDVSELSYEDWLALRKEISLGSIFISGYRNSYGVDDKELCDICDMYLAEVDDSEISPESFARYMFEYAQGL